MNNCTLTPTKIKPTLQANLPIYISPKPSAAGTQSNLHHPSQNTLLAALPAEEMSEMLQHLEWVELAADTELYEFGTKLDYVYFPTTAVVSLLYVMEDGAMTEIAVMGHEGMVGMSLIFGDSNMGSSMVQNAGAAYRMKATTLKRIFNQGGELQRLLMRYTHAMFAHMAQSNVCGRHYSVEQKLSRWLLDRLDRLQGNEMKVTQELIANMLGVRRESITEAAGKLQSEGLIQYRRGNITVLDRASLEIHAGECYKVAKNEYDMLLVKVGSKTHQRAYTMAR